MVVEVPNYADLVIVGSGPIGSAFARGVRDRLPQANIVVVEAGPRIAEPPGMNVRNFSGSERVRAQRQSEGRLGSHASLAAGQEPAIVARPGTHLVALRPAGASLQDDMPAAALSTNVGGMGAHWTCAVPRPGGSERIDFLDPARLDAAYREAEKYLSATTEGFTPTAAGQAVLDRLSAIFVDAPRPVQPMPLACQPQGSGQLPRWSGADVVLGDLAASTDGSQGFTLLDQMLCTRVLTDGDLATGLEVKNMATGAIHTIAAAAVVVAADALRTPQVLWASGIRPAALGRYLNDQPQLIGAVYVDGALVESVSGAAEDTQIDARDALTGVCWVPFSDDHPYHVQVMQMDASPIQFGQADPSEGRPVVGIGFFCAKTGEKDDRVELSETETDAYGMPAMTIHYRLNDADHRVIAAAEASLRNLAGKLGEFIPGGEPKLLPAGSSLHYQGSTRMGPLDDGASVCDERSKVWGYRNLFVGGNGVIPTALACNPTLTSVALAVLAADAVVEQIQTRPRAETQA